MYRSLTIYRDGTREEFDYGVASAAALQSVESAALSPLNGGIACQLIVADGLAVALYSARAGRVIRRLDHRANVPSYMLRTRRQARAARLESAR